MLNKRLVLASNSPRRIALLKLLGYYFEVIPHEIDECIYSDVSPTELVQNLAFLKANDVARKVENAIVIGADTIVLHDMCVLGKPKDRIDAKRILSKLCNSEHDIISGVCII
ncbi:MAG: Maf family protein, partial [Planctomycetota bacterium]